MQIEKQEIKLCLSADDMVVYGENTKQSTTTKNQKQLQQGCRMQG